MLTAVIILTRVPGPLSAGRGSSRTFWPSFQTVATPCAVREVTYPASLTSASMSGQPVPGSGVGAAFPAR